MRTSLPHSVFSVILASLVAGGCTIMQGESRQETESMLLSSGFKMKLADTPEKLAVLESKPQRKVLPVSRHGKMFFGYTDAKGCKCPYLGDEAAYKHYETLVVDNRLVEKWEGKPAITEPANVIVVTDDDEWEAWGGEMW